MKIKLFLAAAALAVSAASAHAANVVISDNFNSDTYTGGYGMNYAGDSVFTSYSPAGNMGTASVDLVGAGTTFPFPSANGDGLFIDMDGSTGSGNMPVAGALVSNTYVAAGDYVLTYSLAGNQRGYASETTYVGIVDFTSGATSPGSMSADPIGGQLIDMQTPVNTQPFMTYTDSFYTTGGYLAFADGGPSDQVGNLLDNVLLTSAAPEPASWALMIAGVGFVGGTLRMARRRSAVAA